MELGIIHQLEKIAGFQDEYRDYPVSDVLPEYIELLFQVNQIKKFLEASTGAEYRDEYYNECEKNLLSLKQINGKLTVAREEVNKKRTQYVSDQDRLQHAEERADEAQALARIKTLHRLCLCHFRYRHGRIHIY